MISRIQSWYLDNRILAWICTIIAVNQLGFGGIIPIAPLYAQEFGVSQTAIGITIAVYGLARFVATIPAGWVSDLFGRRSSLAVGGAITVVGNVICGLSPTYEWFLAGRFVAGAGAAMILVTGQIILADITTPERRGRTMALYQGVNLASVGFGPLPGGILAELGGLSFPFLTYAVLGGLAGSIALLWLPETRHLRPLDQAHASVGFISQIRLITSDIAFLLVCMISFVMFFARNGAMFNLVPIRAENVMGLSPSQIGFGMAFVSGISIVLAYPSGYLVDRFGRKTVIVPAVILSAIALSMYAWPGGFSWFLVSCMVWGAAVGIGGAAPAAYAADVAPQGMQASGMGTYRLMADAGYTIGPLVLGLLADGVGVGQSLIAMSIILVICAGIFAFFAPETHRRGPA